MRWSNHVMSNMKYINRKISGKSVLFEPVLLQVAQLGIYFYCFYNTQVMMHLLEGLDKGRSTVEEKLIKDAPLWRKR